jgi:hypothetical protein
MVESVGAVPIGITRLANIDACQDNKIFFSEEEFQDIKRRVIGKRKVQELWDVKSH